MIDLQNHNELLVPAAEAAPALPIEVPIVGAALYLSAAQAAINNANYLVRHMPRNEEAMTKALQEAMAHLSDAWAAYDTYREIGKCRGQA